MITREQVTEIVNAAWDGVCESKTGRILFIPDPNNMSDFKLNQMAFSTFTIVLAEMMRGEHGSRP